MKFYIIVAFALAFSSTSFAENVGMGSGGSWVCEKMNELGNLVVVCECSATNLGSCKCDGNGNGTIEGGESCSKGGLAGKTAKKGALLQHH